MAKILPNEKHPNETVLHGLANESFKLTAKGNYETDNPITIANAEAHPWLTVEYPEPEAQPDAPEDARPVGVAIESGLNQNEEAYSGDTPVTLAADDAAPDYVDSEGEPVDAPATLFDTSDPTDYVDDKGKPVTADEETD